MIAVCVVQRMVDGIFGECDSLVKRKDNIFYVYNALIISINLRGGILEKIGKKKFAYFNKKYVTLPNMLLCKSCMTDNDFFEIENIITFKPLN